MIILSHRCGGRRLLKSLAAAVLAMTGAIAVWPVSARSAGYADDVARDSLRYSATAP